jgi:transcriptional regulator with XRE-family HTH domain
MVGISPGMMSGILNGKSRPSWKTAKKLSEITNVEPSAWMDWPPEKLKKIIQSQIKEQAHNEDCVIS